MKNLLFIFSLLASSSALADAESTPVSCVDLSYKTAGGLLYRQVGCEKFRVTFLRPDGSESDVSESIFSENFVTTTGDTEFQTYSRTTRWLWSRDGKSLIQDSYSDVINKASLDKMYWTTSRVYTLDPSGKVRLSIHEIFRVESVDGTVSVETEARESLYDRLIP
jgi:hypothetical protein